MEIEIDTSVGFAIGFLISWIYGMIKEYQNK